MTVTTICYVLGALLRDNMSMGAFHLRIVTYIIDLLARAHSKLVTGLSCLCSISGKVVTDFGFFFVSYRLVSLHVPQPIVQPNV